MEAEKYVLIVIKEKCNNSGYHTVCKERKQDTFKKIIERCKVRN